MRNADVEFISFRACDVIATSGFDWKNNGAAQLYIDKASFNNNFNGGKSTVFIGANECAFRVQTDSDYYLLNSSSIIDNELISMESIGIDTIQGNPGGYVNVSGEKVEDILGWLERFALK